MTRIEGAQITREQFLMREMRIACQLREEGLDDDALVTKIKGENLIQYPTERMVGNIARVCVKRMNAVESERIVRIIATGLPEAAAQANLYAMMSMMRIRALRCSAFRISTFCWMPTGRSRTRAPAGTPK